MPGSEFARLLPDNKEARYFFSFQYQQTLNQGYQALSTHMFAETQQQYDPEMLQLRWGDESRIQPRGTPDCLPSSQYSDANVSDVSDSLPAMKALGMVWVGYYTLDLHSPPADPTAGWTVGTGRKGVTIDLLVAANEANQESGILVPFGAHRVRGCHAAFNFHESTALFYIRKLSRDNTATVSVDGHDISWGQPFTLNKPRINISIGQLKFILEYTDVGRAKGHDVQLQTYMRQLLGVSLPLSNMMPTPAEQGRTFGKWTLGRPLGKGASGKVWAATDSTNRVVAVKVVERRHSTAGFLEQEVPVLDALKKMAEVKDDGGRLVRLVEVLYPNGRALDSAAPFDEVALVLEPATSSDFAKLLNGDIAERKAMHLFLDALKGVCFLHDNNWLHGDLKPANIGILGDRAVLLDIGGAKQFSVVKKVLPTPGVGGTIGYLAPEQEMQPYDSLVDVWAMGVVGFQLRWRFHPWNYKSNPWRSGNEHLRPKFLHDYNEALSILQSPQTTQEQAKINDLLVQMLRYSFTTQNCGNRVSVRDAIMHECWRYICDTRPAKRARLARS